MKLIVCLSLLSILVLTGCKNISPTTTRTIETAAVAAGVGAGLARYPTARPYVQSAATIICAESASTNGNPEQIIADIQNSPTAGPLKTAEGTLIINGAVGIYSAIYDNLGTNKATMLNYLGGLCDGMNTGLAFDPVVFASTPAAKRVVK